MIQPQKTSYLFLLLLVASLHLTCFDCLPTSTTQDQQPGQGSSPSPSQADCSDHRRKYDNGITAPQCDFETAIAKLSAGTLQYNDIEFCYRPRCDAAQNKKYLLQQCFINWCWCSNTDGSLISGTFQKNMPPGFCVEEQKCKVDGTFHDIGAIFTPSSGCGRCECNSNGTHTCYVEYTVDENNRLSNDQLESLKEDLILLFNLQHTHRDDDQRIDVQRIYKEHFEVSDDERNAALSWKFTVYDKNEDSVLSRVEEFVFHEDLASLFGCSKFFGHLNELMDGNDDHVISPQEWKEFFGVVTSSDGQSSGEMPTPQLVAKRQAVRRPLNLRKKSPYYIA